MKSVFALVDCENFYVSCERVFDPALRKLPLVVLSNNDGCVIARSQQVKAAGVPMGAPYFQWEDELDALDAVVRSSNYALYGDMSRRVMQELEAEALEVERYSIDEAFLTLPAQSRADLEQTARRIQQRVRRRQGLPLRIAVGPTKTLAKAADEKAKANEGVFVCPPEPTLEALLRSLPVGKVWGIGRAYEQTLQEYGVDTAAGFRALPDQWIRRKMSVVGLRTAHELRGRSCLPLDLVGPDRKSLIRSRSFGTQVHDKETLREALAKHAQRAAEKLRTEQLVARGLQVFITTKQFGDPPHYANGAGATLVEHTAYGPAFIRAARRLLEKVYKEGPAYKKAGVLLYDIRPERPKQESLFGSSSATDEALMAAVDGINRQMGRGTIGSAATGCRGRRSWTMKRTMRSPRYTTQWTELPVARCPPAPETGRNKEQT